MSTYCVATREPEAAPVGAQSQVRGDGTHATRNIQRREHVRASEGDELGDLGGWSSDPGGLRRPEGDDPGARLHPCHRLHVARDHWAAEGPRHQSGKSKYIRLRFIRGEFLRKRGGALEIAAQGRDSWMEWFELEKEPVKAAATDNVARIVGLLGADVLCVVEAENRILLKRFNDGVMSRLHLTPYTHVMLIDGNDDRGIDGGILTKKDYPIVRMLSHVDDSDEKGSVFSRDCAEHEVKTPQGFATLILLNHFKSKGYGPPREAAEKRLRQATRVRKIYDDYRQKGYENIAVVGDLNDVPDGSALGSLVGVGSTLTDIMAHPRFVGDARPGTRGNGTASGKFDCILMSPPLSDRVVRGGIGRRGVWGGANGMLFPHLATIRSKKEAASDHAALWVDLDI